MARQRDDRTLDMFEVPRPASPVAASMDYRSTVAHLLADALKAAEGDRYDVAAEASRLVGRDVSKAMLDAYTSEARNAWNLPFWLVPALETACRTHALTQWLAEVRGGRLYVGGENLAAQLGRLMRAKEETEAQIRRLKKLMREAGND